MIHQSSVIELTSLSSALYEVTWFYVCHSRLLNKGKYRESQWDQWETGPLLKVSIRLGYPSHNSLGHVSLWNFYCDKTYTAVLHKIEISSELVNVGIPRKIWANTHSELIWISRSEASLWDHNELTWWAHRRPTHSELTATNAWWAHLDDLTNSSQ